MASLSHEKLTPLNSILNITDQLQIKLLDIFSDGADDSKSIFSQSSTAKLFQMKKISKGTAIQLYEDSRLIQGSAQMLKTMLDSQMTVSKIMNNQL